MSDTFHVLGQEVNGVEEYFHTKRSCDLRSRRGQKVVFCQYLEIEMSVVVGSFTTAIGLAFRFGVTFDLSLTLSNDI